MASRGGSGGTRKLAVQFTAIGARVRKQLLGDAVLRSIEAQTEDYANQIVDEIREYPPEPSDSNYVRTQELHDSWRVRRGREGGNVVYFIENDAEDPRGRMYATYVQGNYQTPQHADTGWKNINDYTQRATFQAIIQGLISEAAAGFTLG